MTEAFYLPESAIGIDDYIPGLRESAAGDRSPNSSRPIAPMPISPMLRQVHARVRSEVPALSIDGPRAPDVESIAAMIAKGALESSCDGEVKQEIFQFQFDNAVVRF